MTLGLTLIAAFVVFLPQIVELRFSSRDALRRAIVAALLAVALLVDIAPVALAATALSIGIQALASGSRTGSVVLGLAAVAASTAAGAVWAGAAELAFVASLTAIALKAGVIPLHPGVASIAERQPSMLVELGGSAIAAVYVHQRFIIPETQLAYEVAVPLVMWGSVSALIGALLGLVQPTLRGLWSSSITMHAGMLVAAVGAAGRGHTTAALFVAVTFALALGGFGATTTALEARVGPVSMGSPGGRLRSFPALGGAFAFFAAASVALPGTAGFVADDLLLHALWEESPVSCALVIAASATLAIGLFRGFSLVFLGVEERPSVAPDLRPVERLASVVAIVVLVTLGVVPLPFLEETAEAFASAHDGSVWVQDTGSGGSQLQHRGESAPSTARGPCSRMVISCGSVR